MNKFTSVIFNRFMSLNNTKNNNKMNKVTISFKINYKNKIKITHIILIYIISNIVKYH